MTVDDLRERAARTRRELEGITASIPVPEVSLIRQGAKRRHARRSAALVAVAGVALAVPTVFSLKNDGSNGGKSQPQASGGFTGSESGDVGSSTEYQSGPVLPGTDCSREPLPFEPTYLPNGWNRDLQMSETRDSKADGTYTTETIRSWEGPNKEAVAVYRDPSGIERPEPAEPIMVLGGRGEIGNHPIGEFRAEMPVISVGFSWCGFRWALVGVGGATLEDVRKIAEGFVPRDR